MALTIAKFKLAFSSAVNRLITAKMAETVSVLDFGAVGDGITDDTDAIQKAIAAADVVTFPRATYVVSDTLKVRSNQTIDLQGSTIYLKNASNVSVFQNADIVGGNTGITVKNGVIDSNKANQTVTFATIQLTKVTSSKLYDLVVNGSYTVGYQNIGAIDVYQCSHITVQNCVLSAAGSEGLYFRDSTYCKAISGEFYNCTNGSGCATTGGDHHEFIAVHSHGNAGTNISLNSPYSVVNACIVESSTTNGGIAVGHPGSLASYSVITGNIITGNTANGVSVQSGSVEVVVSNNRISSGTGSGNIAIRVTEGANGTVVSGNTITGNGYGVYVNVSSNVVVTGNTVKNNANTGIHLQASPSCSVIGNICDGNATAGTGYGIYCSATSTNCVITQNQCIDTQTVKTQQRGIYSDAANNVIAFNILTNNTVTQLTSATAATLSKNILSTSDVTKIAVTLTTGVNTVISNANVQTASEVTVTPTSANAYTRTVYKLAQGTGTITLGHTAGGAADTVEVIIS